MTIESSWMTFYTFIECLDILLGKVSVQYFYSFVFLFFKKIYFNECAITVSKSFLHNLEMSHTSDIWSETIFTLNEFSFSLMVYFDEHSS